VALLRHSPKVPNDPYYWARVPLTEGHAFELAGWAPLPSGRGTEAPILELLDARAAPAASAMPTTAAAQD